MLAVDLELGTTEPVLRMTTDYGADPDSRAPVEACTYFEWLLKWGGEYTAHEELFKAFGHSVSGPIHRATPEELEPFNNYNDHFPSAAGTLRSSFWVDGEISVPDQDAR